VVKYVTSVFKMWKSCGFGVFKTGINALSFLFVFKLFYWCF